MSAAGLRLRAGDTELEVDALAGGRMSRLRAGGHDLLVGPDLVGTTDPIAWGCYPMVPWAGRMGGARFEWHGDVHDLDATMPPHAIHGTTHRRAWDVVDARTLRTGLGDGWPFAGQAVQRFDLTGRSLTIDLEVRALDQPFPATVGWHPWFIRTIDSASAELRFHADQMYERGPDHLPTGRLVTPSAGPWDDAFTGLHGPVTITWADRLRLTIESDLDHLVVYDEPDHALCVEPQSGPPDAIALRRAATVTPARPLSATMRWSWEIEG